MADAPPYSRIREAGGLLFTAGILGMTDQGLAQGVDGQIGQAVDNLEALLTEAGSDLDHVVRLVVYLVDIDAMDALNDAFVDRFAEPRPARTTVAVAALPGGALAELEATVER